MSQDTKTESRSETEKKVEKIVLAVGVSMIAVGTFALGYLVGKAVGSITESQ